MDGLFASVPFTTSGALVDSVDKKIIAFLRDGRKLIGVLRSYDQYANLVLQDAIERVHVDVGRDSANPTGHYTEIWRGIYLVRGENVVLMGEIDLDVEDEVKSTLKQAPSGEVLARQKREYEDRSARTRRDEKVLFDQAGFGKEGDEGDRY